MSRWTKLQILFQFHLINYRRRKILLVPAFANADADLCVPEYNPQKGLLWTNCVCRMDREPVYFSKSGFLNKYKAPYFWRQLPNNLYNTAVLRSHISHLFFFSSSSYFFVLQTLILSLQDLLISCSGTVSPQEVWVYRNLLCPILQLWKSDSQGRENDLSKITQWD